MKRMPLPRRQQGAVLVMGLIFMILMMLAVIVAFRMSSTNMLAVGNTQSQSEADAAAQRAIERVISTDATFFTPQATNVAADGYGVAVAVAAPQCIRSVPVNANTSPDTTPNIYQQGVVNAANSGFVETYWDVAATATGAATGANVEMHQGVRLVMPSDPNPCP
jgi:Tfp pilus assembly protein PilX